RAAGEMAAATDGRALPCGYPGGNAVRRVCAERMAARWQSAVKNAAGAAAGQRPVAQGGVNENPVYLSGAGDAACRYAAKPCGNGVSAGARGAGGGGEYA